MRPRSSTKPWGSVGLAIVIFACSKEAITSAPQVDASAPTPPILREAPTLDRSFRQIAELSPGFAGMYYEDGVLVVRSTEMGSPTKTMAAVREVDEQHPMRGVAASHQRGAVRFEQAMYDFPTLEQWKSLIARSVRNSGLVFFDVDERQNRVVIGVTGEDVAESVRSEITKLGIDMGAVLVEGGWAHENHAKLTDRIRPFPGGVEIDPYNAGACSAGVIADPWAPGLATGFITASHCTAQFASMASTTAFYQDNQGGNNLVGYELADPPPFTGANCPAPVGCRFSDAAFIGLNSAGDAFYGAIARTTGLGSTTIDSWTPRFLLNEPPWGDLLVGDSVNFMGKTSGWRQGQITRSCTDITDPALGGIYVLCTFEADYPSGGGDSGAPVFTWSGTGSYVDVRGIHQGIVIRAGIGTFALFSKWRLVALELSEVMGEFSIEY